MPLSNRPISGRSCGSTAHRDRVIQPGGETAFVTALLARNTAAATGSDPATARRDQLPASWRRQPMRRQAPREVGSSGSMRAAGCADPYAGQPTAAWEFRCR